jgi:hypothetical protein
MSDSLYLFTAWPLKMRPTFCPETSVSTTLRYVTSQKSEYLMYTAAEVWNHAS